MQIKPDNQGQLFVEWEQKPRGGVGVGGFKRAWIRRPTDPDADWAGTGRYINVAAISGLGQGPVGKSADFPIFNKLEDEDALVAFVASVCGLTGSEIP